MTLEISCKHPHFNQKVIAECTEYGNVTAIKDLDGNIIADINSDFFLFNTVRKQVKQHFESNNMVYLGDINTLFLSGITLAYSRSSTVVSVIDSIIAEKGATKEVIDELLLEICNADQSTQATLNTPRIAVEEKEYHFALWFQSEFSSAYEHHSKLIMA